MAALILAFASIASRLLGMLRDSVFATRFGAGDLLDAYSAAFRLPDLLFNFLLMGALSAGLIPVFSEYFYGKDGGKKEAFRIISGLLNFVLVGWLVLGIAAFIFAPWILKVLTPGFPEQKILQSSHLARIMILSPLFLAISAIWGGVLQSLKRFLIFAFSPIFYNVGIIFGAIYLVGIFGPAGLAWGVVLGAFLHMVVQFPSVWQAGWRPQFFLEWHKGVKEIMLLTIPRSLAVGIAQLNFVFMTALASILAAGSLTIFTFANNLQAMPVGLVGVSLSTAAFPSFVQAANQRDFEKLGNLVKRSIAKIMFFIIPSSFFLYIIREPLVELIFAHNMFGKNMFSGQDVFLTAQTLKYFVLGVFAQSLVPLLARIFFAFKNTRIPFYIGLAGAVANAGLSYVLSLKLGVAGLSLGFALASIFNLFLLVWYLRKKFLVLGNIWDMREIMKSLAASLAAAAAVFLTAEKTGKFFAESSIQNLYFVLAVSVIFVLIWLAASLLLKQKELFKLFRSTKKRLL